MSSVWNKIRDAMGNYYNVFSPKERTMQGGSTPTRILTQTIAGSIPAGTLDFISYIGIYPEYIQDSSSFQITKLATSDGNPWISESNGYGDFFGEFCVTDEQGVQLNAPTQPTSTDLRLSVSPNPFNPTTTIRFDLPEAARVSLEVFDINGRMVGQASALVSAGGKQGRLPHQDMYDAGTHTILFDGSDLPSGVYLAQLQAGEYAAALKLVLLK